MIKSLPNDTYTMDIRLADIYKIYALVGYSNNSQFEIGYKKSLWADIQDKFDSGGYVYEELNRLIGSQKTILDSLDFINNSPKEKHLGLFNCMFNKIDSQELEIIESEIVALNELLDSAYMKKKKLLDQS